MLRRRRALWLLPGALALIMAPSAHAGLKDQAANAGPVASPRRPPSIRQVQLGADYVPAGGTLRGAVLLDVPSPIHEETRLRVLLVRGADVAASTRGAVGRSEAEVLSHRVAAGSANVPFSIAAGDMLFGSLQVRAEVVVDRDSRPLSVGWSAPVRVGLRKRLGLGGRWAVTSAKVLEGDVPHRPKDWKLGALPATVELPGRLPFDRGFRGWVTVRREVAWKRDGDLRPRLVCISGASDSARVRVDGAHVGETSPVDDVAVLTHWVEFHCPFKGPENEQKRMLLIAGGDERPWLAPLPKALPPEGKAQIELAIRATSGGILGKPQPPYGILDEMHLELVPPVYIRSVSFDTEKLGEKRRFRFTLTLANDTGKSFKGTLRAVYGRYHGEFPYTGACPAYASSEQRVSLPAGESTVEAVRDEMPRFDTCRATFLVLGRGEGPLDAAQQDFHTMAVEIRDRRDIYLNNERFIVKGQGSWGEDANSRLQLRVKGGNAFRGHRSRPSLRVPELMSEAANIDERYTDGLLTSAGSALLASCEKCTFWDPKDPSNVHKAVKGIIRRLGQCPGIIQWEATNELHGEPEEARVEILKAFHRYDPYHRPVLATKSSGEWEAVARGGRVAGVDIVGCQYLLTREAVDSITAAVAEQPIMSTEVNWNDATLYARPGMFQVWLDKGLSGSLLFDYSGRALTQPVPTVPPDDRERSGPGDLVRERHRKLYQDMAATATRQPDGRVRLTVGNRMPYTLRGIVLSVRGLGRFRLRDLGAGDAATVLLPAKHSPAVGGRLVARAEYTTHRGLKHLELYAPRVVAAPQPRGGQAK